jgi:hypothetical protein
MARPSEERVPGDVAVTMPRISEGDALRGTYIW